VFVQLDECITQRIDRHLVECGEPLSLGDGTGVIGETGIGVGPEFDGIVQYVASVTGVSGAKSQQPGVDQSLETMGIDGITIDAEAIGAVRRRGDQMISSQRTQLVANVADVHMDRLFCRSRRPVAPHGADQPIDGHLSARRQRQARQQTMLPVPVDSCGDAADTDLEGTENTEVDRFPGHGELVAQPL
jgi:hypothetical protein